ncbi:MAG: D-alanyl-D-alanine carboxypeptidase, partial [Candidatus Colwellbacteria bacterium]|nr:D-alanyl-D-alanine carboxypeptidase [Candidatus Colwellbacteria bacterium]
MKESKIKTLFIFAGMVLVGLTAFVTSQMFDEKGSIPPPQRENIPVVEETSPNGASLLAQSAPAAGPPNGSTESQINVSAAAAYLMGNEEPLYIYRGEKQWPIASVTKLMSSFIARRLMPGTEVVTMDERAVAAYGEAGDFKVGERFTADDLIKAMLIVSSNDAAEALVGHYGQEKFIAEMNRLAAAAGMSNTVFADATGLSARNISTANDLNRLVQFIWSEDPKIFAITRLSTVNIVDIEDGRSRKLVNINLFAGRSNF